MKLTIKVLSSRDYDKLAEKYPKRSRESIIKSWGFADKKKGVAFVRQRKNLGHMKLTALHELDELISKISPHEEHDLRFKSKGTQPSIQYTQSPWQEDFYKNVYQPNANKLQELFQQDLSQPLQLSDEIWGKIWNQSKEKTLKAYEPVSNKMSQMFASTGALDNSGQVQKWFGDFNLSKAKSIEDLAVNQAIAEWENKVQAKQQNYNNIFKLMGLNPPDQQAYIKPGDPKKLNTFEQIASFNPMYSSFLTAEGYNPSGPTMQDWMKLFADSAGAYASVA